MTQAPEHRLAFAAKLALLALFALGLWRAASLAWLCDDSFISIRYAQNLVDGNGLVYNAGEYVEGYTNLSWTLLLAAFASVGVSPVAAAQYLGIVFLAALAGLLAIWSRRRSLVAGAPFLPLAAGLCLVSGDFQVWATGGLETMQFTFLATLAILLVRWPEASRGHALGAGAALAVLALTRLDGLLFAVAAVASFWLPGARIATRERMLRSAAVAGPVALVLAALLPWKLAYYGELLPTAFYSKSVLSPYVSQGLIYVALYLLKNWFLPVTGIALLLTRVGRARAHDDAGNGTFLVATAVLFLLYVVEVGGDFMFARRVIPVVPLLFVAIEGRVGGLERAGLQAGLAAVLLTAAILPLPLYGAERLAISGVMDERRVYPPAKLAGRELQGRTVGAALDGVDVRVAYEGGMCVFGYYSGLPYLVELTGLTQYSLAKRPLAARGQVGHEKAPDAAWFEANRIHFVVRRDLPPLHRPVDPDAVDEIRFGDVARATILRYEHAIMDPLRGRSDVSFVPIEVVIERASRRMQAASPAAAEEVLAQLSRYYFDAAGERGRPAADRLRAILAQKRRRAGTGSGGAR
jgi:arabinofuranosyltransferase